jgi:hypothetical protein
MSASGVTVVVLRNLLNSLSLIDKDSIDFFEKSAILQYSRKYLISSSSIGDLLSFSGKGNANAREIPYAFTIKLNSYKALSP